MSVIMRLKNIFSILYAYLGAVFFHLPHEGAFGKCSTFPIPKNVCFFFGRVLFQIKLHQTIQCYRNGNPFIIFHFHLVDLHPAVTILDIIRIPF